MPIWCIKGTCDEQFFSFSKLYRGIPNVENLTPKNYISTFFRKSTSSMFQVQVRAEIFSEDFFEQRSIVEFGIPRDATVEERKRFEEREREVRDKFLTFSEDQLFIGKLDGG